MQAARRADDSMLGFAVFFALIAVALVAIAALGYPAWLLTLSLGFDFRFPRVALRLAMLVLVIGFVLVARRLRVADRVSLGYDLPARRFLAETARAWLLGLLLMLPVLLTMLALDLRELKHGMAFAAGPWIKVTLAGLLTGLVVGSTEETFMRGA